MPLQSRALNVARKLHTVCCQAHAFNRMLLQVGRHGAPLEHQNLRVAQRAFHVGGLRHRRTVEMTHIAYAPCLAVHAKLGALHAKAKAEAGYRSYVLYHKISREDILAHAYAQ
jgi:hypothetical protein